MYQQKNLAKNLKKYRKLRGLTQIELAERLFVTAQNVSKWEMGKSVPDLDNLCKLAAAFDVSPDRLLGNEAQETGTRFLAAIDGGGTKTEFVLYTETGEIRKRLLLGGCNSNTVGMERAQTVLRTGLDQLLAYEPNICAVYAGIAGCGLKSTQKKILTFLQKTYPMLQCNVASDVT
ncbi:MAG: XRE family transcriptional regulator, partial [Firmicutes bacterium]|nr:XRE family transcriptional regulator [Bacillota bacterium]